MTAAARTPATGWALAATEAGVLARTRTLPSSPGTCRQPAPTRATRTRRSRKPSQASSRSETTWASTGP